MYDLCGMYGIHNYVASGDRDEAASTIKHWRSSGGPTVQFFYELACYGNPRSQSNSEYTFKVHNVIPTALVCLVNFPMEARLRCGEFQLCSDYSYLERDIPWEDPDTTLSRLDYLVRACINAKDIKKYPTWY